MIQKYFSTQLNISLKSETQNAIGKRGTKTVLSSSETEDIMRIYDHFEVNHEIFDGSDFSLVAEDAVCRSVHCDDCERAFIAGAFLSCGFVYPPEKKYQAEL